MLKTLRYDINQIESGYRKPQAVKPGAILVTLSLPVPTFVLE